MRLGIDFGTTRTVVAYCDRGNYPILSFSETDDTSTDCDGYPSVVAERDGEFRFAFDALALVGDPSWTVMRSFKRVLSEAGATPDRQVRVGSTKLPVLDLLTRFLTSLRDTILTRSNLPRSISKDPEMSAVVATPANALGVQRFLTLDAFRRAGFNVLATLNEPSAAGFEYSHRHRNTLSSRREHVVVYDLGGGTFDASLVRMSGRLHDAVTTAGMQRLGGDDFDDVLLEMVLEAADCPRSKLNSRSLASLFDLCRDAKERLHPNSKRIVIDVDQAIGKQSAVAVVTIGVNEYYEKCTPLVEKTIEAMTPVMSRLERDAPISDPAVPEDVAGIYVVGGASSLPIVVRLLRERFGRRVHRSPYPSAATAVGLAIASDRDAGFELSDRFSRTFGVFREITAGHDVGFDTVFHRDTQLPSPGQPALCADRVYRPVHNLGHFRYVECSDLDYHGTPIGDISLFADVRFPYDPELQKNGVDLAKVNVQRLDRHGPTIRERYQLDAHGMVALTVTDLSTSYERVYKFGN